RARPTGERSARRSEMLATLRVTKWSVKAPQPARHRACSRAMPAVPPPLLHLAASALSTRIGRRAVRRAVLAGTQQAVPLFFVEWMAGRRPAARAPHDASPIVTACDAPATQPGPLDGEAVVVKDALDVGGVATGLGLRAGAMAEEDAELV